MVHVRPRVDHVVHATRRFARERATVDMSPRGARDVEGPVAPWPATAGGRLADPGVLPIVPSGAPVLRLLCGNAPLLPRSDGDEMLAVSRDKLHRCPSRQR